MALSSLFAMHPDDSWRTGLKQFDADMEQFKAGVKQVGVDIEQFKTNVEQVGTRIEQFKANVEQVDMDIQCLGIRFLKVDIMLQRFTGGIFELRQLSYEERLKALRIKFSLVIGSLKSIQQLNLSQNENSTLKLYNSLRIFWDQEPAYTLDKIDYSWLMQHFYLVNNNLLLENLEDGKKIARYVTDIKNACSKLTVVDIAPMPRSSYTLEALAKYNNLRQLSKLPQASSINALDADWLNKLSHHTKA